MAQLTGKQQKFIDAYLGEANCNAYRAAKIAGYKGNGKTLRAIASENLTKPNIKSEIAAHFEANAMSKGELAALLADQARVNIGNYYSDGVFDIGKFIEEGYGHLIKTVKRDRDGNATYEFTNKERSQELIARCLGMLVDKSEMINIDGGSLTDFEEWKKEQGKRQNEAMDTLEQFDE